MLDKLRGIEEKYEEINRALLEVGGDYQRAAELNMERSELEPLVEKAREYRQALERREEARSLLEGEDEELRQLAEIELEELDQKIAQLEREIKSMLLPRDKRDTRNVIVEIRAGTGGEEAALFAADLFRMYSRYAEKKGWEVEVLSANETGIGGYKEIIFMVRGRGAYSRLKYESGVHRVQRVPITEASGRIHTSTATVAVLAEADEVEVEIPESDLRIDVYKSAGAGGQNVQKNATAVRITHLPTGIVVQCQDERSQLQNKQRAMSILRARLYEMEMEKQRQSIDQARRSQVGTGERAEKIRTYNYPQSRVTDHRINFSSYNLPAVMEGEIDEFIEELALRDEAERLAAMEIEA
ncbi:MAG: peptide chain release factor 1 [Anaerolineales bacterium]|nr:peptide chain release factor 1 [Anaerolineales bacterium]MDW8160447.1 peptide chain release factor 1 [Anaerolineales bacterium]